MNDEIEAKPMSRARSPSQSAPASVRSLAGSRRRWVVIAVLLLAATFGAAWWGMRGTPTVRYVTVQAKRGAIAQTVTATGTVNPELTIIVGTYVSGVIQQLYCDYNTQVKAGQVCAKIDPRPYQTIVNQDKANLAVARAQLAKDMANLTYTKLNYERNRRLAERQSVSQDAADVAKNAFDQAQAQVGLDQATIEQRQAELDAAEVNLGYTNIISPVDGTVVSRNVTQGQTVAASFQTPTLFLIATDLTRMQVDTNVSESDIGGVRDGDKATFTVDAFPKRVFKGTVTQVRQSPQTVQNVVTFDVVVSVDNRDLALKPGMTASTRVVVEQRDNVLRVPKQALRYAPEGPPNPIASQAIGPSVTGEEFRIWVLREGRPVPLPVVLGLEDESFTEILKGELGPDDQVIIAEERGSTANQRRLLLPRF